MFQVFDQHDEITYLACAPSADDEIPQRIFIDFFYVVSYVDMANNKDRFRRVKPTQTSSILRANVAAIPQSKWCQRRHDDVMGTS